VTKIKGWSQEVLPKLSGGDDRFDVIYVDGDHSAAGVNRDCVLSWPLLAPGGIMIIDDYGFMPDLPAHKRPQAGVDAFLAAISSRYDELHRAYQLVIQARRADGEPSKFWQQMRDAPDALLTYSQSQMKYEMLAWARPFEKYR